MLFETNKDKGSAGMALAIAYFGATGYTINIPLNDTQWYDFVIEKNGKFETVQCKATGSKNGRIDFRSTGGTKGNVYDVLTNYSLDCLFCIHQYGIMFCIPGSELPQTTGFNLRTTPTVNKQGFQTYKYIVKI